MEARAGLLAGQRGGSAPALVPRAITAGMPAAVAISAATTFERIPPEPSGDAEHPIWRCSSSSKRAHVGHQPGVGVLAGSAV